MTREKCLEIKPLERSPFYRPVVKVETVYVDVCPHLPPIKQKPHEGASQPKVETLGGITNFTILKIKHLKRGFKRNVKVLRN